MENPASFSLLKTLCELPGPSGNEGPVRDFLVAYAQQHQHSWQVQPQQLYGPGWQDCLVWAFGTPKLAIFVHMDTVGFTVRYDNKLVPIGGPEFETGWDLVGHDSQGPIETKIVSDAEGQLLCVDFQRPIDRGTELTFAVHFQEDETTLTSAYLDDRLGIFTALQLAPELKDVALVFSCWEEHRGGSVAFLIRELWERWRISKALVLDITWATEGVFLGQGPVISLRDMSLPRKTWLKQMTQLAADWQQHTGLSWQAEVEAHVGSDGKELQASPYPIDWVFIGVASQNPHTPFEKVDKNDCAGLAILYKYLIARLLSLPI